MKIRTYLEKKKQQNIMNTLGVACIPFFTIIYFDINSIFVIFLIAVSAFAILFLLNRNVRCPKCDSKLGWRVFSERGLDHISNKFTHCKSCHVSFDDEMDSYK